MLQHFKWTFVHMDPLNVPATFEVRSFTQAEMIGGTLKHCAVPGYAHAPFSPKILMCFCSDGLCYVPAKFEVCSFARS